MRLCLIVLCSLALLSACSKDDDIPNEPQTEMPISFRNTKMDPQASTRAVGLEEKNVYSFYVWSYKTKNKDGDNYTDLQTIMEQYKVQWVSNTAGSTTSNVADWEYVGITDPDQPGKIQNIKYWDMEATSYRFFGIAPVNTTGITYGKNTKGDEYDFTFHADATNVDAAPYISKLWITDNTSYFSRKYGDVVTMEFMKPVSKVRIQLIDETGSIIKDPATAGVTSLSFEPTGGGKIVQQGTLTVSYPLQGKITFTQYLPKLKVEGDPEGSITMERLKAINDDPAVLDDYADWYYVLPHILQNAFQLKLTVFDKPKLATVPAELMSWNPNMEYTYRFKLTASDVQFIDIVQIGVTSWRTEPDKHDVYNW